MKEVNVMIRRTYNTAGKSDLELLSTRPIQVKVTELQDMERHI